MMKYTVDFNSEINSMLKEDIGLCPFFKNNSSRFFERLIDFDLMFHRYFHSKDMNRFLKLKGQSYLRNMLKTDESFDNPLFHLLFRAFVYSETKFIRKFIPQNSHEERLTGHLISELANSMNIISNAFEKKSFDIYKQKLDLEFYYADLSSNNFEKHSGADFTLLFHINLPDYPESVRVIVCQAKKFNKNATIDINQINTLKNFAGEAAYYCFYDMNNKERISPMIQKADPIISKISDDKLNQKTISIDRESITQNWDGGIPLSIFLTFELLNLANDSIKTFENIWEAKSFISKSNDTYKPSRVLTVSLGGISKGNQDLRDMSELFNFEKYSD